jgi:hypothetical protein
MVFKLFPFSLKRLSDFLKLLASTLSKNQATSKVICVLSALMVFLLIALLIS